MPILVEYGWVGNSPQIGDFLWCPFFAHTPREKQDAQLSQKDRAAGCVIVFAKSRTLELGANDLRTL